MVAIVSGSGLGLDTTSFATLAGRLATGTATQGRNGERAYVNVATGNLVLQDLDDHLVAHGPSVDALRTYNSQGQGTDDNRDRWTPGFYKSVHSTGQLNEPGSTIVRVDGDAGESRYDFDPARGLYVSTEGAGSFDTIAVDSTDGSLLWTDGGTGVRDRYDGNGQGQLLSITDRSGNKTTYTYAISGVLMSVADASGETTYLDYADRLLTQVRTVVQTDSGPQTMTRTRYTYDALHRLETVTVDLTPTDNSTTDLRTFRTSYAYETASGAVSMVTRSDGTTQSFSYVRLGAEYRVESVTDGMGNTTSFSYDLAGRRSTVTDPLGLVTVYEYDAKGQLTAVTTPAVNGVAQICTYTYDAAGNVTRVVDPEGQALDLQYDANGNQTVQRDSMGNTLVRTYDLRSNDLLTETVYRAPDSASTGLGQSGPPGQLAHPGHAQPDQPNSPNQESTTRYVYDGQDRLRFVISPEGRVSEFRYNGFGERVASLQYSGAFYLPAALAMGTSPGESVMEAWLTGIDGSQCVRADSAYDFRGQLASTTTWERLDAAGNGIADGSEAVVRQVVDQSGRLLSAIGPGKEQTQYTYDGLGRLLSTSDALGHLTMSWYDDQNNATLVRLANGLVNTTHYDRAGRLISVSSTDAALRLGDTRYLYDADGRLRMTQDPTGIRHFVLYDEKGRKTADIDGDGGLVEYRYDRNDRLVHTIAYAASVNTGLLVDAYGKPAEVALATLRPAQSAQDRGSWNVNDTAGNLVRTIDKAGLVVDNVYDSRSQLVSSVQYAQPIDTSGLRDAAQASVIDLMASADDRVTRSFYDRDGLLRGSLDGEGNLVEYRYNAASQLAERIDWANPTPVEARATGMLESLVPVASKDDIHTRVLYNARGQEIARVDGEGYLTERVYDRSGNLTLLVRYATPVKELAAETLATLRPTSTREDRSTRFVYDALERLIHSTDGEGAQTAYAYDNVGNLLSTSHAAESGERQTVSARYDAQGRLTAELSAEGSALLTGDQTQQEIDAIWQSYGTRYTYDAATRRTSTTDAVGNRTLFYYDADSRLVFTVNALGEVEEHRYNALNQLTGSVRYGTRIATTGRAGGLVDGSFSALIGAARNAGLDSQTTIAYNRNGMVQLSTDELGNITFYDYDAFGEVVSRVRPTDAGQALTETFRYDRRGLQTGAVADDDANGITVATTTDYDAFGRAIRKVDGNGNVHGTSYDKLGRVIISTDPLNGVRRTSYDAIGRVLTSTDATGNSTTYRYDSAGRSVTMTTAEGIVVVTTHNGEGQVQSITDGRGATTQYSYDRNGNLLQTETRPGHTETRTSASYDHADRKIQTIDANGNRVDYHYDAANRVLSRQFDPSGLNLVNSYRYDAKGQQIASTDANGVVTQTEFDLKGQVLSQTVDPSGLNLTTRTTHDARGNTLTVVGAGGTTVQYVYDDLGRRTEEHLDPAGHNLTRRTSYDANGNPVGSEDGNGNLTRYVYDADDRLVYTVDAQGDVRENRYDAAGRLAGITRYATAIAMAGLAAAPTLAQVRERLAPTPERDAVENRAYDKDGRLSFSMDGTGAFTRYAYDANGNVIERLAYANRIDPSTWNGTLTLAPLADPAHDQHQRVVYDALNRALYSIDGSGAVVEQHYDANGNVVERIAYANTVSPDTSATPATLSDLAAAVARIADGTRDAHVRRSYDTANRLTWSVDGIGAVTRFIYDSKGNLVRQIDYAATIAPDAEPASVTGGPGDRIVQMRYDDADRLVFRTDPTGAVTQQVYDANGNLVERIDYATTVTPGADGTTVIADQAHDRITRMVYDSANRQVYTIDAQGDVVGTRYDGAGNAVVTTSFARAISTAGLSTSATVADVLARLQVDAKQDRVQASIFDAGGRVVYRVDAEAFVTQFMVDGVGNLTGSTRYATALAAGTPLNLRAIAAALQPDPQRDQITEFTRDAQGRLLRSVDAMGNVESSEWDGVGNKLLSVDRLGQASIYDYDAAGRLIFVTAADGTRTSTTYDSTGNLLSTTNAGNTFDSRTLSARYDAQGRLTGELSAEGSALLTGDQSAQQIDAIWQSYGTKYTYDVGGRRTGATDANGNRTLFYYDADSRLIFTVNALGEVEEHRYNALNQLTGTVLYGTRIPTAGLAGGLADASFIALVRSARNARLDSQTAIAYSGSGTVSSRTDELGNVTSYTYDAFGEVVARSSPIDAAHGLTETFRYDRRGLQTGSTSDPKGAQAITATTDYDAFGRAVRTVDGNGNVHAISYDRLGRVITSTGPLNGVRRTSYDAIGRVLTSTDATGNTTSYRYDSVAHSLTMTTAEGIVVVTTYNYDGQVKSITDGRGVTTQYGYDRNGNLLQTTMRQGESETHTRASYDHANRKIQTIDANGNRVDYHYDAANRVLSRQLDPSGLNLISSYRYDARGQQIASTDANGIVTQTEFDLKGQVLSQTVDPSGLNLTTRTTHDARGNTLTVTSPGGTVVQYVYDNLGRRIEEHLSPSGPNLTRRYTYDQNSNLVSIKDAGGFTTRQVYDANNRLVYTIDAQGDVTENRYDAEDRVTGVTRYATAISMTGLAAAPTLAQVRARLTATAGRDTVENRVFDKDGRLTMSVDGAGAVTRMAYDANGNVVERIAYATRVDPAASRTAAPKPDADHDLHQRSVYDALNRALYTIDGSGAVVQQHYDANGNVVERIAYATTISSDTPATAGDLESAVARIADGARDVHVRRSYDAANRVVWSVDGLGAVTRSGYDSNGNLVRQIVYAAIVPPGGRAESVQSGTGDRIVQMQYDAANRLVFRTDPAGAVTQQVYDSNGNLIQRIDYATAVAPGADGAAARADPAHDRITRTVYDSANRQVYTIDAQGYVTGLRYDGLGHVTRSTRYARALPAGVAATLAAVASALQGDTSLDQTNTFVYDSQGRLLLNLDAMGKSETNVWDALGNKLTFTNKKGAIWRYEYDAAGNVTTEIAPAVDLSTLVAAADGTLNLSSTVKTSPITRMQYDAFGNLTARTEAAGRPEERTTRYVYDARGRQVKTIYPVVNVYNAAADELLHNGMNGLAARTESQNVSLSSEVTYDALDNAVLNRDVSGNVSSKAYDAAGRVRYEIDAEGYVTGYHRNIFGETTELLRYAAQTGLTSTGATAPDAARVEAAINAPGVDHSADRLITTTYDQLGRAVEVVLPQVYSVDGSASSGSQAFVAGNTTRNDYDAFGQLVRRAELVNPLTETWAVTRFWYDACGNQVASVDALGYVTDNQFDAEGNVVQRAEYAQAAANWNGPGTTSTSSDDRITRTTYDLNNRAVSETRLSVEVSDAPDGTSTRADLTTAHGYDAVGNLTRTTDAAGNTTFSYFDALGRVSAVAAPAQYADVAGSTQFITPLTEFLRDAYGNVLAQIDRAAGASSATATGYTAAPNAADHIVRTLYDSHGHASQVTDALGNTRFTSYDAGGHIAKQWQVMTGNDGIAHSVFKALAYDRLGRQVHMVDPASNTVLQSGLKVVGSSSQQTLTTVDESGATLGVSVIGTNSVTLAWSTLIDPRGGGVRVDIGYASKSGGLISTVQFDETGAPYTTTSYDASAASSRSVVYTAAQVSGGVTMSWGDEQGGPLGFDHLNSCSVYQQDTSGQWALKWAADGSAGTGSSVVTIAQDIAGLNDTATGYNGFGEVTRQNLNGGDQTTFEYDNAGRVWRTNAGDGVTKVELYDLHGRVSADVRSADRRLSSYGSAEQVANLTDVRRTDTATDLLGRQVLQVAAERNGMRPVVTRTFDRWGNVLSISDPRSPYWLTTYRYNATNQMVSESKPDAIGNPSAAGPTTQLYYDRLGHTVAVRDANGNLNGQVYDAAGNLVEEHHADGGMVYHHYDAFGNQVRMVDAMGNAVDYSYDADNRLTQITRGTVAVYAVDGSNLVQYQGTRALTQTVRYDQLGHTLAVTNGNSETTSYGVDLAGNVTSVTQPLGQTTRAVFNAEGRKTAEVDANGFATTALYDHFGHLLHRTDLGGADTQQIYDVAGQLVNVNSTRGQNIGYYHDDAGQLIEIDDWGINEQSAYAWDAAGNRVHETTVQNGVAVQDNALGFDALNRLVNVSAQGGVQIHFDYDRMDNRVHEHIEYQPDAQPSLADVGGFFGTVVQQFFPSPPAQGARTQELWYAYDAMNRQILVDGALNSNAGDLGNLQNGQGHIVAYDKNGNRISDTFVGNHVTQAGGETVSGTDESGNQVTVTNPITYGKAVGVTSEAYRYDVNNRMVEVQRDGVMIDTRYYDGADRVVQTGPAATLSQGYVEQLNDGPVGNGSETRINRYDLNGSLLHQQVSKSDGEAKYDIDYQYDGAGNVVAYTDVIHGDNGYTASYRYSQLRQDGYKEGTITGTRTDNAGAPGVTTNSYDVNGTLVGIADSTKSENDRSFISDAAGIVLQKTQQGHVQRQIVVGGQVIGQLGTGLDPLQPVDKDGNQRYIDYQNFNIGYRAVDANYPTAEAGSVTVQAGDTLQGIAQSAYGDSQLWYLIADANGIQGNSDLRVGQTLQLPNRVGTIHNDARAFKPYEPGKVMGDTTPNLPAPSGGDDCGGFGMILVIVVAVVVTVLTAGAATPALGSILGGAVGAVAGSVASQLVGMAIGVQQDFSWSSVALAAVGGAVAGGLETFAPLEGASTTFGNTVARGMIGNAVSQGIGVATGLQKEFSWVGVAAAGVGAGVGFGMSEALGITLNGLRTSEFNNAGIGEQVVTAGLKGFAAGVATAVARGGRINVTQVAADAFGNALGNSLADYANGPSGSEWELQQREDARDAAITLALSGASSGNAAAGTGLQLRPGDAERFYPTSRLGNAGAQSTTQSEPGSDQQVSSLTMFRRSEIEAMNMDAKVADALASSRGGWSDITGMQTNGRTIADLYSETYGGQNINVGDRLSLSSGVNDIETKRISADALLATTRALAEGANALMIARGVENGQSLAPTIANAGKLGLYDTSVDGMPVRFSEEQSQPLFAPAQSFDPYGTEVMYRGMSVAQFKAAQANSGGFETFGRTGYMSPELDYIRGLEAGTGNGNLDLSVKVKYVLSTEGMESIRGAAYSADSGAQKRYPENPVAQEGTIDLADEFTLKLEKVTGAYRRGSGKSGIAIELASEGKPVINLGVGRNVTGEIKSNIVNWSVVDSTNIEVVPGVSGQGDSFLRSSSYNEAVRVANSVSLFGRGIGGIMMATGAYVDGKSLVTQYGVSQSIGDYSNTVNEGTRIAGGWSAAYVGGQALGSLGAGFGTAFGPIGAAFGGVIGGVIGSGLGYWGGSYAVPKVLNDIQSGWHMIGNGAER
ncbi:MAG: rane protein of unknown function [Herminiimonas sp.]|nr:rane protein of unknown function [Herminiimonas sp.]